MSKDGEVVTDRVYSSEGHRIAIPIFIILIVLNTSGCAVRTQTARLEISEDLSAVFSAAVVR